MIWHRVVIYDMTWYRIVWYRIIYIISYHITYHIASHHIISHHFIPYHMGTSCPGYELSWVRVVLGTSCLWYELSWVRVVLVTSCLGYELSWVRVVLGTSCPDPFSGSYFEGPWRKIRGSKKLHNTCSTCWDSFVSRQSVWWLKCNHSAVVY